MVHFLIFVFVTTIFLKNAYCDDALPQRLGVICTYDANWTRTGFPGAMLLLALKAPQFWSQRAGSWGSISTLSESQFPALWICCKSRQIKNGNTHHSQLLEHLLHSRCCFQPVFIASVWTPWGSWKYADLDSAGLVQGWRLCISNDGCRCHGSTDWTWSACVGVKSLQSCPTLCDPMDCSLPGSSVHGILQARMLEWVAMPSSKGSFLLRDLTQISYVSCIGKRVLYH